MDITSVWPDWEVVRKIGSGSFGNVYEIQRDMFGEKEKAAMKVVSIPANPDDIDDYRSQGYTDADITKHYHQCLQQIIQEYALMAKIKGHSNVVSCEDIQYVPHEDGIGWNIYIKMELLHPLMKSLGQVTTEHQIVNLGIDISNALVLCKERNIIHRDIKPQNIFVSDSGSFKLGDFGIAKTVERTTGGTRIGTYKYMAPEVYNNHPYGAAADVYSLGLVLYWLLNEKRTPFLPMPPQMPTATMEEAAGLRRFRGEAIPEPKYGSPELKRIVLKACAYASVDRYATAAEMLQDLRGLQNISAVPFTPIGGGMIGASMPVASEGTALLDDLSNEGTMVLENAEPYVQGVQPVQSTPVKQEQTVKKKTALWVIIGGALIGIVVLLLMLKSCNGLPVEYSKKTTIPTIDDTPIASTTKPTTTPTTTMSDPCALGHDYKDGKCSRCDAVDHDYNACDHGKHNYQDGWCVYCAAEDPDFDYCEVNGHDYIDGWCNNCAAEDPDYDYCAINGHDYQNGYCVNCLDPDPNVSMPDDDVVPTTQATTKPTTKATTKPTTKATTKPTTKTTTKPTTKATTKLTTKATTKPTTKATTKPTTKVTTKPTTKATTKLTTKATTKPTTKATTKATTISTTKMVMVTFNANGGVASQNSMTIAYGSTYAVLPIPTRDGYTFLGWFTAASGGTQVTSSTQVTATSNHTLYAQWKEKEAKWVLADQLPTNAIVIDEKWTYTKTETTTSTAASMDGWVQTGYTWQETGTGIYYYSPKRKSNDEFNTEDVLYTKYNVNETAKTTTETATTKREYSTPSFYTYLYWHWVAKRDDSSLNHLMSNAKNHKYSDGKRIASEWEVYESSAAPDETRTYTDNGLTYYYYRKTFNNSIHSYWWYRNDVYKQTYTDYQKLFTYQRVTEGLESQTSVTAGGEISDVQHWVLYREK